MSRRNTFVTESTNCCETENHVHDNENIKAFQNPTDMKKSRSDPVRYEPKVFGQKNENSRPKFEKED